MLQCALTSSHPDDFSDIVTYCNNNNILGGGGAGHFGGKLLPLKNL